jgi:cytochrome c oxidase assembly protein subunit 15
MPDAPRLARPPLSSRRLTPAAYRKVTLGAVWALGFIIVTGGAVRLTGSGLGCPDWPTCASHRVVAPWRYHAMVEFGNRVVTGLVCIGVILAVLGSWIRAPRRRDLGALSWGLVLGVLAQIVLGGEAVKHQLAPPFVMAHFLVSMLLLADAVVLYHRAGQADGPVGANGVAPVAGPTRRLVAGEQVMMSRLMLASAAMVIFLGTIVTSSGPHGGDPKAKRLDLSLHQVARLHGTAVLLFLAVSVVTLWTMVRGGAPDGVVHRGEALLVAVVAQGAVGYIQYFTGVPAALVVVHIALASAVWALAIRFHLGLSERPAMAPAARTARPPAIRDAALAPG